MSFRQQQIAVFLGTVVIIFGLFAAGLYLIANRLRAEATVQTSLLLARQVEIALADSLKQRAPAERPQPQGSFWGFLGRLFPGEQPARSRAAAKRGAEVKGLIQAYVDRGAGIEAMWVLNSDGLTLYSSRGGDVGAMLIDEAMLEALRRGESRIATRQVEGAKYYDVVVPLQMPPGAAGPGGLRLWINPERMTELLAGVGRQLTFLLLLGGVIALSSALLATALYTRRFRIVTQALSAAEAGTYQERPSYRSRDEIGASLDLIDRLVAKQRGAKAVAGPLQRLAMAARTLAHEAKNPLNAMAIHLELLRKLVAQQGNGELPEESLRALEASIRQLDHLVRGFSDYAAPVSTERGPLDLRAVLEESLEAFRGECAARGIELRAELPAGPLPLQGDKVRLRQAFDNLIRNAVEAQPNGGAIHVRAERSGPRLILDFCDRGPGVPPERLATLFEFGRTTKPGGSGLGLPLSQIIVEAHGGTLEYRNGGGPGATFRMTFPLEGQA